MKIILILLLLTITCQAQVVLHRYTEGGEERGVCYSGADGSSAINNPAYMVEVINQKDKHIYIALHKVQLKAKADAAQALIDKEKGTARTKLKGQGLTDKEVDLLF